MPLCFYWVLQYFEKCLGHFFKLCTTQNVGVLYGSQVQHSLIICYKSQLLFKEWRVYCMKTLPFSLSLYKLQGNWRRGAGGETRLLKFKNFHVTDLIWQDFWENLPEYMGSVDALIRKEYVRSQNQSGRGTARTERGAASLVLSEAGRGLEGCLTRALSSGTLSLGVTPLSHREQQWTTQGT